MKKVILLNVFCIITFSLFALVPDRAVVGTGNDLFSMGLSRNDDDQLSFSLNSQVDFGKKSVFVKYDSITNKGWKEGWSAKNQALKSSSQFYSGRYDNLIIAATHEFDFDLNKFVVNICPGLGFDIAGNLGSEKLQNFVHKKALIHSVNLEYDSLNSYFCPLFLFDSRICFEKSDFVFDINCQIEAVPSMRAIETIWVDSSYRELTLSFGYKLAQYWSSSATDKLYLEFINGAVMRLQLGGGLISADYVTCLETGYGFGVINFDVMALWENTQSNSPMTYSLGLKKESGLNFKFVEVNYEINDTFSAVLSDSYISGEPDSSVDELNLDLTTSPRIKWNNAYFMGGINVRYNFDIFSPYVSLVAGIYKTEKSSLNNTIITSTVRSETLQKSCDFSTELKVGTHIKMLSKLGFDIFTGLNAVLSSTPEVNFIYGFGFSSK